MQHFKEYQRKKESEKSDEEILEQYRKIQEEYNCRHQIVPKTIRKEVFDDLTETFSEGKASEEDKDKEESEPLLDPKEVKERIDECQKEMKLAAKELRFEDAVRFRDLMKYYQELQLLEDRPI